MFTLSYRVAHIFGCMVILISAAAQGQLLGEIDFPNSGSAEAQNDFLEGVLYLHNFEYDEAAAAFQRAQEIDEDFAMAYWGEAMCYHHSLWNRQARASARDVLRKLGRDSEARAAKAGTQREKDYLAAAEILFGMTESTRQLPKPQRDIMYRDTMRRLHETYPDDHEATTLYGLSILTVGSVNREYGPYMQAAAVLTKAWDANRNHPGAAHYLIHSYDDPVHAPLGLPMARAYSKIAPAAAHAQHMTSHIFVALGMWDDLVDANEKAMDIEFGSIDSEEERPVTASHYVYWLAYGYLQQGRVENAKRLMTLARDRLVSKTKGSERAYYGTMYARLLLDAQRWDDVDAWAAPDGVDIPTPNYHFVRAIAAINAGDLDLARERMQLVTAPEKGFHPEAGAGPEAAAVLRKELESMLALAEGDMDSGVALAQEAVALADAMPFKFGPPHIVKPSREYLGEALLAAGRAEEAMAAFKEQLDQTPRRGITLLGLARAAAAHGDEATAADARQQLRTIWSDADDSFALAKEAQSAGS